jgi:beta-galactosidase
MDPEAWNRLRRFMEEMGFGRFLERVESPLEPLLHFGDGRGALFRSGRYLYLAAWPSRELLEALLGLLAKEAGLSPRPLAEGLRLRRRGPWVFAFNYGPEVVEAPAPEGGAISSGEEVASAL